MKKKWISILLVLVMTAAMAIPACADEPQLVGEVGSAASWVLNTSYDVLSIIETKGSCPEGLALTVADGKLTLSGTPTKPGVYQFQVFVECSTGGEPWNEQMGVVVTIKGKPTITKQPTGETVDEGGMAEFIARADYYETLTWRLVSADTRTTVNAVDAGKTFPGLVVTIVEKETLILENIPAELDGWSAEAKFEGGGEVVFSNGAIIHVNKVAPKAPVIKTQPKSAEAKAGESVTLSVAAESPDNVAITYQWYKNNANSNNGGTLISGATGSSYSAPYAEGESYYYCEVKCAKGDSISEPVKTECAVVTGAAAAPTPTPTAAPTQETPAPVVTQTPEKSEEKTPEKEAEEEEKNDNTVPIVIGVVACVTLLCVAAVVIQLVISSRRREAARSRRQGK